MAAETLIIVLFKNDKFTFVGFHKAWGEGLSLKVLMLQHLHNAFRCRASSCAQWVHRKIHCLPCVVREGEVDWQNNSSRLNTTYFSLFCAIFTILKVRNMDNFHFSQMFTEHGRWLNMDDAWWEWLKMQPYWLISTFANALSCAITLKDRSLQQSHLCVRLQKLAKKFQFEAF